MFYNAARSAFTCRCYEGKKQTHLQMLSETCEESQLKLRNVSERNQLSVYYPSPAGRERYRFRGTRQTRRNACFVLSVSGNEQRNTSGKCPWTQHLSLIDNAPLAH